MDDKYLLKLYNTKGNSDNGTEFDLLEAINAFSFEDLYYCVPEDGTELEGCAVITGKQVIVSYSKDHGLGVHNGLYARVMKDLKGGGSISNNEIPRLAAELQMNYIRGRIDFSARTDGYYGRTVDRYGCLAFNIPDRDFTEDEIEQFRFFYDNYNESIKWLSSKSNFEVTFVRYQRGTNGEIIKEIIKSKNLDLLKEYIESRKANDKNNGTNKLEDEVIISSMGVKKR